MPNIKKIARTTKNHVHTNRAKYAAAGTAIAFLALMRRNAKELYAFLEEHGIDPMEYYCPEYYAELNNS